MHLKRYYRDVVIVMVVALLLSAGGIAFMRRDATPTVSETPSRSDAPLSLASAEKTESPATTPPAPTPPPFRPMPMQPPTILASANAALAGYSINKRDTLRLHERNGERYCEIEVRAENGREVD